MTDQPYQFLPALTAEEYAALREDIAANGIRVPVDVDEDGQTLDGHHRQAIAAELGVDCPTRIVAGLTEEEKRHHALAVNLQRRTLTRDQRRELVAVELEHDPSRSDRAIARLVGVDHKTVGAIRRGGWGIPHPLTKDEAEDLSRTIEETVGRGAQSMVTLVDEMYAKGATEATVVEVLYEAERRARELAPEIATDEIRGPLHDILLGPALAYARTRGDAMDARLDHASPRVQDAVAEAVRRAERIEQRGGRGGGEARCSGCVLHDHETTAHYVLGRPGPGLVRYIYRDGHGVIYDKYVRLDDIADDVAPIAELRLPTGETYYERRRPLTACEVDGCRVCEVNLEQILEHPDYGPYVPHRFLDIFPLVPVEQFAAIVESVKRFGLLHPIDIAPDGRTLVDGRIRYLACRAAGVEPKVRRLGSHYDEVRILDHIKSANLVRTHLSEGQAAGIEVKADEMAGGGA